jgi:hypothetical protein
MLDIKKIRQFPNEVDWNQISSYQVLSEDFIKEFKDKVNWYFICRFQKLSEDFIKEFKDKVNWDYISDHQKLSEKFIKEFQDKVNWTNVSFPEFNKSKTIAYLISGSEYFVSTILTTLPIFNDVTLKTLACD